MRWPHEETEAFDVVARSAVAGDYDGSGVVPDYVGGNIPADVVKQLLDGAVRRTNERLRAELADATAIADRAFEQYATDGYHNPDAQLDGMLHAWGVTRGFIPVSDVDVEPEVNE